MPKGPQGQKRPADVIGNAVHVMRVLTGQEEESVSPNPKSTKTPGRNQTAKASCPPSSKKKAASRN